jgi:hypothetical protein
MLVPMTDPNNPYSAMLLDLIGYYRAQAASLDREPAAAATGSHHTGLRTRVERSRAGRRSRPVAATA